MRWNQDRTVEMVEGMERDRLYDVALKQVANTLSEDLLGKKVFTNFQVPRQYTGT